MIVGLANGSLVIYQTEDLKKPNATSQIIHLCKTEKEGGTCPDNCNMHAIACVVVAKRRLYCGSGNDIVVCNLQEDHTVEVQRRWSIQDRHKQCVLNIAVGSYIWTSTKDSPCIDYWDISKPVLRGTVNCATMANVQGESRDLRIVSMLHDQSVLWVGLGTGHVIVVSTKLREPLYVFKRHAGSVRCLAIARRSSSHGKPVSLLMTGGMGFIERPGFQSNERDFGYVLVWEADLSEQSKRLNTDKMKRHQKHSTDTA